MPIDPVLVTGITGQVGGALVAGLYERVVGVGREELNLSDPQNIYKTLESIRPAAIINPAAYTLVDKAEEEEMLATAINADAPAEMARYCRDAGIPFVHYSTDYVFDGHGERPWKEEDATGPLGAYGRSKLAGEQKIAAIGGKYLIFRTSWVYDATGKNFVNTMLRFGAEREQMRVVSDQFGAPTYAPHLATATVEALENAVAMPAFPSGIYHLCNGGVTNWHAFAEAIFAEARVHGVALKVSAVEAIPSSAYPTPAKRPTNSRLNMDKLRTVLGITMPDWTEGLKECMEEKYGESHRLSA
ncbi:MAG: dTDP-4-dehydrorhamnose reductase [Alphaproteobacteria bacterium]|nr:dTDP-4-dehydrorhamnose reductase [Alphaproteobacteria bacterium]